MTTNEDQNRLKRGFDEENWDEMSRPFGRANVIPRLTHASVKELLKHRRFEKSSNFAVLALYVATIFAIMTFDANFGTNYFEKVVPHLTALVAFVLGVTYRDSSR
jgi:hypothetical protein